jgi:hypothetical protein
MGPRAGLDVCGKFRPHWDSIPVASVYTDRVVDTFLSAKWFLGYESCVGYHRPVNRHKTDANCSELLLVWWRAARHGRLEHLTAIPTDNLQWPLQVGSSAGGTWPPSWQETGSVGHGVTTDCARATATALPTQGTPARPRSPGGIDWLSRRPPGGCIALVAGPGNCGELRSDTP